MCDTMYNLQLFNKYYMMIYPPIWIVSGCFNNTIIFILMTSKLLKRKPNQDHVTIYYWILSIGDVLSCILAILPKWLKDNFKVDLYSSSELLCRVLPKTIPFIIGDFCIWLVVILNVDRFTRIYFPIQFKTFFRMRNIFISLMALLMMIISKNIVFSFERSISAFCSFNNNTKISNYFTSGTDKIVSLVLVSFLPVVTVLILNILILIKWKKLYPSPANDKGQENVHKNGTRVFLAVSLSFLTYLTPFFIVFSFSGFTFPNDCVQLQYSVLVNVTESIFFLTHITNLYFYVLYSKSYRLELVNFFKGLCPKHFENHVAPSFDREETFL